MPTVDNNLIENLTAIKALNKGYLSLREYDTHVNWVNENRGVRDRKTFVYINGVYSGMATTSTTLFSIIDKFVTKTSGPDKPEPLVS